MTDLPIIPVDDKGEDEDGDDFTHAPSPQAVADGLVTSRPVLLRYPDGRRVRGEQVIITAKGMRELQQSLGFEDRRRH